MPTDGYFADVVAAADIAGKSEYEIVVLLQNKYGAEMTDIVRNGKFETDVAVEENKNYVAVAFGYNVAASEFLTQFFRAEIKNGGDEPGMSEAWVNMACVYGTISGQPGIGAELYPNDKTVKVKAGGFTLTGPATSLEEIGMTEASLRERIMKEGIDVTPSQGSYQVSAPTEYGQVWLFGTIGIDEQGNAGEANWIHCKSTGIGSTEPGDPRMSDKNDETGGDEPIETDAWIGYNSGFVGKQWMPGSLFSLTANPTRRDSCYRWRRGHLTWTNSLPRLPRWKRLESDPKANSAA